MSFHIHGWSQYAKNSKIKWRLCFFLSEHKGHPNCVKSWTYNGLTQFGYIVHSHRNTCTLKDRCHMKDSNWPYKTHTPYIARGNNFDLFIHVEGNFTHHCRNIHLLKFVYVLCLGCPGHDWQFFFSSIKSSDPQMHKIEAHIKLVDCK